MLNAKTMSIDNVYDITTDQALTQPLKVYDNAEVKKMQNWAKSLLQDANNRIIDNKLSLSTCKKG
jgi:hypothetical protein